MFLMRKPLAVILTVLSVATLAPVASATAGKVTFVSGSLTDERTPPRALAVNDTFAAGDTLVTGDRSRAQLLMLDGQRFALRANTRLRVDAFSLPPAVATPTRATAVRADGQSFFTLQKGGLQTQTSAIGKTDLNAYRVSTPVGTLGIRGTDYVVVFCRGDCDDAPGQPSGQPIRDGLYLGVYEGRIAFEGRGLAFELGAGEFAFVPLDDVTFERLREPPQLLRQDGAGEFRLAGSGRRNSPESALALREVGDRRSPWETDPFEQVQSGPAPGESLSQPIEARSPSGTAIALLGGQLPLRRSVGYVFLGQGATGAFTAAGSSPANAYGADAAGNLVAFEGPFGAGGLFRGKPGVQPASAPGGTTSTFLIGTAANVDTGFDAQTGLRWGRWTGGSATVVSPQGQSTTLNLSQSSLPWILGAERLEPFALPISGTATYVLAGGTRPASSLGALGSLSSVFLSANFTSRTVDTTLTFDLGGVPWYAAGPGTISAEGFSGGFSTVTVAGLVPGSGSYSGFFTSSATSGGEPEGAALIYLLAESTNQLGSVAGVAALIRGVGSPAAPPPPPQRNVAFSIGQLASQSPLAAVLAAPLASFTLNGSDLTRLPNGAARGVTVPFGSLDTAGGNVVFTGSSFDAATGMRWGRWDAGSVSIVLPNGSTISQPLAGQSLHWVLGPAWGPLPVLPATGTQSYVLLGATAPTDNTGGSGSLGGIFLNADFTNRTVTTTLAIDLSQRNWWAQGTQPIGAGSNLFSGALTDVRLNGLGDIPGASGSVNGFFSQPAFGGPVAPAVGLSYELSVPDAQAGSLYVINGAAALVPGMGAPPPPPPPPARYLAFALGDTLVDTQQNAIQPFVDSALAAPGSSTVNAAGQLVSMVAGFPGRSEPVASWSLGTGSIVDSGFDAGTRIRWGRWSGGSASATTPSGTNYPQDLANQSLHWVLGWPLVSSPQLPLSGSARYGLVGATAPTDTRGNVGVIGSTDFFVDFTNRTVSAAAIIAIDGRTWYLAGNGSFAAGAPEFALTLAGDLGNLAAIGGSGEGFLVRAGGLGGPVQNGAAFGFVATPLSDFGFADRSVGTLAGSLVFSEAVAGSPVPAPPLQRRDIAYSLGLPPDGTAVWSNVPSDYAIGGPSAPSRYGLERFTTNLSPSSVPTIGVFNRDTSQQTDEGFSLPGMLRWGRWSDGVSTLELGNDLIQIDTVGSPLHWIMSADSANAPALPVSGTASYTFVGGTSPTDENGTSGVITNATFAANFTDRTVTTTLDARFGFGPSQVSWQAAGTGSIANGTNQFSGTLTGTRQDAFVTLPAFGEFNGFFAGPSTGPNGAPNGVGLSYALFEPQTVSSVNGVAAFVGNP
jgi:hypothetical protein